MRGCRAYLFAPTDTGSQSDNAHYQNLAYPRVLVPIVPFLELGSETLLLRDLVNTCRMRGALSGLTVGGGVNLQSVNYTMVTGPNGRERVEQGGYVLVIRLRSACAKSVCVPPSPRSAYCSHRGKARVSRSVRNRCIAVGEDGIERATFTKLSTRSGGAVWCAATCCGARPTTPGGPSH